MADETTETDGRANPPQGARGPRRSPTSMDKTAVVAVIDRVRHPRYSKTMQRTTQAVRRTTRPTTSTSATGCASQETRPLSKLKRWRVVEVLERAR